MQAAPSRVAAATGERPQQIAQQFLARFGDRRYVHRIELGSPPPITLAHLKGYYAGARPPADAFWAYIAAPAAVTGLPAHASSAVRRGYAVAAWESELVKGALRDEFCAAGGRPLVGSTVSGVMGGVSDHAFAFGQRFPNPSAAAFRARVDAVGRRYGFEIESLRLLRPLQLAPLLIVTTSRDRKSFVADVPAIMRLLDPTRDGTGPTAVTFEGFLLEADDSRGPFVRVDNAYRGVTEGGEWSADPCDYPYAHSEPFTTGGSRC